MLNQKEAVLQTAPNPSPAFKSETANHSVGKEFKTDVEAQPPKAKVVRIKVLRSFWVDRWTLLLPQQEVGIVENANGSGWVDWDTIAMTRPYAEMLKKIGVI